MMDIIELKDRLEKEAIKKTDEELRKEKQWEIDYENRANKIIQNKKIKEKLSKKFYKRKPFTYYENITRINQHATKLVVSVRYLGQEVAEITVLDKSNDENVTISTAGYEDSNRDNFGCNIKLDNVSWNRNAKAKEFRKFFREREKIRFKHKKQNEEHRIESALLTEFLKTKSEEKLLCGIQPVTFAGFRFPMPTAITASKTIQLGGNKGRNGGGIDILARTKGKKITVFELKDENKEDEDISKVLEQATAYAIFLINLLRSNCGKKWYKIMGFNGDVPKSLTIRVCGAMPIKKDGSYDDFETFIIKYKDDILEYHWLYFEEDDKEIKGIETSINK